MRVQGGMAPEANQETTEHMHEHEVGLSYKYWRCQISLIRSVIF
jgi:hypothetical protein